MRLSGGMRFSAAPIAVQFIATRNSIAMIAMRRRSRRVARREKIVPTVSASGRRPMYVGATTE
jgi:hypothetical protein